MSSEGNESTPRSNPRPDSRQERINAIAELSRQLEEISRRLDQLSVQEGVVSPVRNQPPRARANPHQRARAPATPIAIPARLVHDRDYEVGDEVTILNNYHPEYEGATATVERVFTYDLEVKVTRDGRILKKRKTSVRRN